MDKKTLVRFNVQNIKYALPDGEGGYATPVAYGTAISMAPQPKSFTATVAVFARLSTSAARRGQWEQIT